MFILKQQAYYLTHLVGAVPQRAVALLLLLGSRDAQADQLIRRVLALPPVRHAPGALADDVEEVGGLPPRCHDAEAHEQLRHAPERVKELVPPERAALRQGRERLVPVRGGHEAVPFGELAEEANNLVGHIADRNRESPLI